eukprot:3085609-Alexandrium_andersonii.AAC.1
MPALPAAPAPGAPPRTRGRAPTRTGLRTRQSHRGARHCPTWRPRARHPAAPPTPRSTRTCA